MSFGCECSERLSGAPSRLLQQTGPSMIAEHKTPDFFDDRPVDIGTSIHPRKFHVVSILDKLDAGTPAAVVGVAARPGCGLPNFA
jgi:hypothetical protein